ENYPPGRLRCVQRTVPAVLEREVPGAEQGTPAAGDRKGSAGGRIGLPHVEPGTAGRPHRPGQDTAARTEPRDMKRVHVRAEELRLPQRRTITACHLPCRHRAPVEHLPAPVPADSRVHASPMPVLPPLAPFTSPSSRVARPDTCS